MQRSISAGVVLSLAVAVLPTATAQRPFQRYDGTSAYERHGRAVALGDLDDDGFADVVVGADGYGPNTSLAGRVRAWSGRTGALLFTWTVSGTFQFLGTSVATADVDADGHDDVIAGAPAATGSTGTVFVWSGRDGSQLFAIHGAAGSRAGVAVAGVGDLDRDGYDDFAIASEVGPVRTWSGRTGAQLHTLSPGFAVAAAGDVDADGVPDVVIGNPLWRAAIVHSGATGAVLHTFADTALSQYGRAVAGLDANGDGYADIAVSGPGGTNAGRVDVWSGRNASLLFSFAGEPGSDFGASLAAVRPIACGGFRNALAIGAPFGTRGGVRSGFVQVRAVWDQGQVEYELALGDVLGEYGVSVAAGDVDRDGWDDLLVGAQRIDSTAVDAGSASVHRLVYAASYELAGRVTGAVAGDGFGLALAAVGDLDGDGIDDFAVGSPFDDFNGQDSGAVQVFSGATRALIRRWRGTSAGDWFGFAVGRAFDFDGDGVDDVIVGAPNATVRGRPNDGYVRILSGRTGGSLRTVTSGLTSGPADRLGVAVTGLGGDIDGDGVPDFAAIAAGAPAVRAFAGAGSSPLLTSWSFAAQASPYPLDAFSLEPLGDLDGDGRPELARGFSHAEVNGRVQAGRVDVFSPGRFQGYRSYLGAAAGDRCGAALAAIGDWDRDGRGDLAVGIPFADQGGLTDTGLVAIVAGAGYTPGTVTTIGQGQPGTLVTGWRNTPGGQFGASLAALGDLDSDGFLEIAAGMPGLVEGGVNVGAIEVMSYTACVGAVRIVKGSASYPRLGERVVALGDVDADGRVDHAGGSAAGAGSVGVYLSQAPDVGLYELFGRGCPGADGRLPRTRWTTSPKTGFFGAWVAAVSTAPRNAVAVWNLDHTTTPYGLDLGFAGAPGCVAQAFPTISLGAVTDAAGDARINIWFPSVWTGLEFVAQWIVLDPARSSLVVSDWSRLTIGR
ncbi:MAG: VCBS repeat-containing protein [Planctomycetes bacterium]|nr:VCBS repeat-containing protein [Planctomycetota bacterium]